MSEIKNTIGRFPSMSGAVEVAVEDERARRAHDRGVVDGHIERLGWDQADRDMLRDMLFGEVR